MDFNSLFKKYGAYLVAAVLFIAAALTYCYPVTQGKSITTGDGISGLGAVQEAIDYTRETGKYSWWNSSMFCGMPNYQIGGGQYKADKLLKPLKSVLQRGHWHTEWILIIYLFCFFILLRSFDIDKWLAIVGSFAISLSSYFMVIIAAGHNSKTSSIALMSVVLAGFYLIFRKKYGLGAVLVMIFTACGFTPHPQMAYYMFMFIGLLWFAELWIHIKEKRMKDLLIATAIFVCAVGIGLGTNMSRVFSNAEYAEQTMRGGHSDLSREDESESVTASNGLDLDYATAWSYGWDETLSFLIPGVKGGSSDYPLGKKSALYKTLVRKGIDRRDAARFCSSAPVYWGDQPFTSGNVYMGAIICFLFLLGLIIVKGPYKWGLLVATIMSVLLALGHNFMPLTEFFYKYFPLYNKFRAVSSILIVAEISMPLLGFLAVKAIMDGSVPKKDAARGILISGGITGGICLLLALAGNSLFSFTSVNDSLLAQQLPSWVIDGLIDERRRMLRADSLRSLAFIVAASAVMWLYVREKMGKGWMIAGLGVLVLLDMVPVDWRYFNYGYFSKQESNDAYFAITPVEEAILQDSTYFRVFNASTSTFNESRTSFRLKSIGGYSAAKLRRYQDLIDEHLQEMHMPVLNMLNTKYFIYYNDQNQLDVIGNPNAMGNAWFVGDLVEVDGANAESDSLLTVDLTTTAVIDKSFSPMAGYLHPGIAPDAAIVLTDHTPGTLDYEYESSEPGTVVFSEIYYPFGWKASIDGAPAEHFRVNYLLRAMNVPAGQHAIHFVFDPDSVRKGDTIAIIFCILMYLLILGAIVLGVAKCRSRNS